MNSQQEWVLRVGGALCAILSLSYGRDNENQFWYIGVPLAILVALVWLGVRTRDGRILERKSHSRATTTERRSLLDEIEQLAGFRERGLLSDEEFKRAKERVIDFRRAQ